MHLRYGSRFSLCSGFHLFLHYTPVCSSGSKIKQMAPAAAATCTPHKEDQLHKHSANTAAKARKPWQRGDKHVKRRQQHVDTVSGQPTCCHLSAHWPYWSNLRCKVDAHAAHLTRVYFILPRASKVWRDVTPRTPWLWVNTSLKGSFIKH